MRSRDLRFYGFCDEDTLKYVVPNLKTTIPIVLYTVMHSLTTDHNFIVSQLKLLILWGGGGLSTLHSRSQLHSQVQLLISGGGVGLHSLTPDHNFTVSQLQLLILGGVCLQYTPDHNFTVSQLQLLISGEGGVGLHYTPDHNSTTKFNS